MERKAEALDRDRRKLNLVLSHVPEPRETEKMDSNGVETLHQMIQRGTPAKSAWSQQRLGAFSSVQKGPRPILMSFDTETDKHNFLKLAKQLTQEGLRFDDYLTRSQQKQRKALSVGFDALKAKGHKPFYRRSTLMYCHAGETHICGQNKARTAPKALP